jgi:hypothetical protein
MAGANARIGGSRYDLRERVSPFFGPERFTYQPEQNRYLCPAGQVLNYAGLQWQGRTPESVAADTTYGNGEFLQWLADRSITPYMRTRDSIHRKRSPFFGPKRFTYQPEHNRYLCPRRPGTQLRRARLSEPRLQLHRDTQKVWPVPAPTTMHQRCLPGPDHPPE